EGRWQPSPLPAFSVGAQRWASGHLLSDPPAPFYRKAGGVPGHSMEREPVRYKGLKRLVFLDRKRRKRIGKCLEFAFLLELSSKIWIGDQPIGNRRKN